MRKNEFTSLNIEISLLTFSWKLQYFLMVPADFCESMKMTGYVHCYACFSTAKAGLYTSEALLYLFLVEDANFWGIYSSFVSWNRFGYYFLRFFNVMCSLLRLLSCDPLQCLTALSSY